MAEGDGDEAGGAAVGVAGRGDAGVFDALDVAGGKGVDLVHGGGNAVDENHRAALVDGDGAVDGVGVEAGEGEFLKEADGGG